MCARIWVCCVCVCVCVCACVCMCVCVCLPLRPLQGQGQGVYMYVFMRLCVCLPHRNSHEKLAYSLCVLLLGLARTKYIRCIYGIFSREFTIWYEQYERCIYTVLANPIYYAFMCVCVCVCACVFATAPLAQTGSFEEALRFV